MTVRYGSITIKTVILAMLENYYGVKHHHKHPVSGSFTVANTAITGATRMRVSMKYNEFQLHVKQSLMVKLKIIP
jgi:hypothetical protein